MIIERLEELVNINNNQAYSRSQSTSRCHWDASEVYVTAKVLQALTSADPENDLIGQAILYLYSMYDGEKWESTVATSTVIQALGSAFNGIEQKVSNVSAKFRIDNNDYIIKPHSLMNRLWNNTNQFVISDSIFKSDSEIKIWSSTGNPFLVQIVTNSHVPISELKSCRELIIDQKYKRIEYLGSDTNNISVEDRCMSGDELEMVLNVKNNNDLEFVKIESPFPAGCEVLNPQNTTPPKGIN